MKQLYANACRTSYMCCNQIIYFTKTMIVKLVVYIYKEEWMITEDELMM